MTHEIKRHDDNYRAVVGVERLNTPPEHECRRTYLQKEFVAVNRSKEFDRDDCPMNRFGEDRPREARESDIRWSIYKCEINRRDHLLRSR